MVKQINGATVFFSFEHDIETSLTKGTNAIYSLAEIGHQSKINACNNNHSTLNATENECTPTQCKKCGKNTEEKSKSNEVRRKPTKCVLITYFYK